MILSSVTVMSNIVMCYRCFVNVSNNYDESRKIGIKLQIGTNRKIHKFSFTRGNGKNGIEQFSIFSQPC